MKREENGTRRFGGAESGMLVVETVLSFTVFLVVILSIIFLTNIFVVHNKIQYAINAAAHEISAYSYLYQALGLRQAEQTIQGDGAAYTKPIDDTVTQVMDSFNRIQGLNGAAGELAGSLQEVSMSPEQLAALQKQAEEVAEGAVQIAESVQKSVEDVTALFGDGESLLAGLIYMGASAGSYAVKSAAGTMAAGALTKKYIGSVGEDADAYLRSYGITDGYGGLDFSGSTLFCDAQKRMVDFVVQYDIDLGFLGLVMPMDQLHVVQRVSVPGWLNGDGKTVEPGN